MQWNLGDIFDAVARVVPAARPAILQGDTVIPWGALDRRSNRVARALLAGGLAPGARVAFLSRNHPAYVEAFVACLKARLVHVNLNYRYRADEIAYVLRDSGAEAVLFQREFAPAIAELRPRFAAMRHWICADGSAEAPATAAYETLAETGDGSPLGIARSGDDAFLIYTGGTTGRPKGVVWPADAVRRTQLESPLVHSVPQSLDEHVALVAANARPGRTMPACPLMHGAGINGSLAELLSGGSVVLLPSGNFAAEEAWGEVARHGVTRILLVGDAFARPLLRALDVAPGRFDLSSVKVMSSAGLIWSREVKQGLLHHMPDLTIVDVFGASEAAGLGYAVTTRTHEHPTGHFLPGPHTVLLAEDGGVLPGDQPGEGLVARSWPLPSGYLDDPAKTAEVFRSIGGTVYAVPGDWARRHADGTISLIGRGNLVINTGGEKVFVEEVEEALKRLPGIEDAMVLGLPDPEWGAVVVALVRADAPFDAEAARTRLRAELAAYKVPRLIHAVPEVPRAASGKTDYRQGREMALALWAAAAAAAG